MKESKELEKFNCKREMNVYIRKNKGGRDEIVRLTSSNMTNTSFFFFTFHGIKFIEMVRGINGNFYVERILLYYLSLPSSLTGSIVISSELVSVGFKILETAFFYASRNTFYFLSSPIR